MNRGRVEDPVVSEPNNVLAGFRVPAEMKADMVRLAKYKRYSSVGEMLRAVWRTYYDEVVKNSDYKIWKKHEDAMQKLEDEAAERKRTQSVIA